MNFFIATVSQPTVKFVPDSEKTYFDRIVSDIPFELTFNKIFPASY